MEKVDPNPKRGHLGQHPDEVHSLEQVKWGSQPRGPSETQETIPTGTEELLLELK